MKKILAGLMIFAFLPAMADPPSDPDDAKPDCNWGALTAYAILDLDFDQGAHSADPSGDGSGQGDADSPRAGLPNLLGTGDLESTCFLIESLLPPAP